MFGRAIMGWEIWKGHQIVVLSEHPFFVEKAYQGVAGLCCKATALRPARLTTPHIDPSALQSAAGQVFVTSNWNKSFSVKMWPFFKKKCDRKTVIGLHYKKQMIFFPSKTALFVTNVLRWLTTMICFIPYKQPLFINSFLLFDIIQTLRL